ncbi:LAMI_0G12200g1_1 [Lachancea mirantina]|uniref:ATP phosphoribosyltransferase n=1 Tax=Lachancea mirantina TaxID=1230905 RepID=A0A1G4KBB0_9SACH|nr:LAMI_0G12200g1_1 [Lachancea mirantina]
MDLVNHLTDRLLFAIPKKGRLYEKAVKILKESDIHFHRSQRLDIALSTNMPIALIFLPAADIPMFVGEGRCDLGITGVDQVMESEVDVNLPMDLQFGSCKLQVQVPATGKYTDPKQLIGKTIVSSFCNLTKQYFAELEGVPIDQLKTKIRYVGGSVEASCALGIADAIVDLVESGETMRAAGLTDIATVLQTSAHLIESKRPVGNPELLKTIKSRIEGVMTAQRYVHCNYNVPEAFLPQVLKITPGRRAPTISQIDDEGWVAVSAMIERKNKGNIMDELKNAGACDIMVFEISNCRV